MDAINLCNAIRMEFEGVFEKKIPLEAFPAKIQDMILTLARQENYTEPKKSVKDIVIAMKLITIIDRNWKKTEWYFPDCHRTNAS